MSVILTDKLVQSGKAITPTRPDAQAEVQIVEKGDTGSDHYNHMEHLSTESGIAVDRWRHRDADYMKEVNTTALVRTPTAAGQLG
jgi:hypothetical protein